MDEQTQQLFDRIGQYLDRTEGLTLDQFREYLLMDASQLLIGLGPFIPAGNVKLWYDQWLAQFEVAQLKLKELQKDDWVEPEKETIRLASGETLESDVNGISPDGLTGFSFAGGRGGDQGIAVVQFHDIYLGDIWIDKTVVDKLTAWAKDYFRQLLNLGREIKVEVVQLSYNEREGEWLTQLHIEYKGEYNPVVTFTIQSNGILHENEVELDDEPEEKVE